GPAIVLLHANGGDHRDFDAIVPALARTRTVYAVDWPGHGDSGPAAEVTACGLADLLPGALEALGDGPFTLVGNSVGGFAALRTAIARPDLVSKLVLVDPGGFTPRTPFMLATCRLFGSEWAAPTVMRQLPRLYLRKATPGVAAVRGRAVTASRSPSQVGTFASIWRSFADPQHDGRTGAERLSVPTLLVWGTRDPVLPWLIAGRRAAKALPGATVVTMPCGHQPYIEMPDEFLAVLGEFLAEPTSASV
ncbi:MAG: alpha/beta fold hydrolase, partial [Candidatus Nanopelagicales bacterium]